MRTSSHALATLLVLAGLALLHVDLRSQGSDYGGTFEWVSPRHGTEFFAAAHAVDSTTLRVFGQSYFLTSTDRGKTWTKTPLDSASLRYAQSAAWSDPMTGWAILDLYNTGVVGDRLVRTTDGGITWNEVSTGAFGIRSVAFANARNGWVVGDGGIVARTTDGGATWVQISGLTAANLGSVTTAGADRAFIPINALNGTDTVPIVLRTIDLGATWDTLDFVQPIPQTMQLMFDLTFPDSLTGYAFVISSGAVYRTSDGGDTWTRKPTGIFDKVWKERPSDLSRPHFIDPMRGWAFTGYDEIYFTSDGADTWNNQDTGVAPFYYGSIQITRPLLSDVVSFGPDTLIVTGANGQILTTTDGGKTWISANPRVTDRQLMAVAFTSADRGWVAGQAGEIFRTTNGGDAWEKQTSGTSYAILRLHALDDMRAWAAITEGVVRTTDGGSNWEVVMIPDFPRLKDGQGNTYGGIRGITFLNERVGWVVGVDGGISKTTDGGATWKSLTAAGAKTLYSVSFSDETNGWVTGDSASLHATSDGGATWRAVATGDTPDPGSTRLNDYNAVLFTDSETGIVIGERGRVFSTRDGGEEWIQGDAPEAAEWTFGGFVNVARPVDSIVWAAGLRIFPPDDVNGAIMRSTDGGESWSDPSILIPWQFFEIVTYPDLSFPDARHGWFVGGSGAVIRYTAHDLHSAVDDLPEESRFGLRAHPDPLRTETELEFRLDRRSRVRMSVHAATGEKVADMIDRDMEPGRHAVRFNAGAFPSGSYFVRLTAGEKSETRMIIITR